MKDIELWLGDCLELMDNIPNGSIDAIITDLPYGTTACKWDVVIPFESMWRHVKRVLKERGVFVTTSRQPFTSALVMSNPKLFKYEWVWVKSQSRGHLNAYIMPLQKHETVLVFSKGKTTYNPQVTDKPQKNIRPHSNSGITKNYGIYDGDQLKNRRIPIDKKLPESVIFFNNAQKTKHSTQKPLALYEYLVKTYTNEGETVLDITMGSGTTMVACKNTNRKGIGIEKEGEYYNIAVERVFGLDK